MGLLLADMQDKLRALTERVEALEEALAGEDEDSPDTYMDGTPVR